MPDVLANPAPDVDLAALRMPVPLPTGSELARAALDARAAARTFEAGSLAGEPWSPACARIAAAIHGALDAEGVR